MSSLLRPLSEGKKIAELRGKNERIGTPSGPGHHWGYLHLNSLSQSLQPRKGGLIEYDFKIVSSDHNQFPTAC